MLHKYVLDMFNS